MDCDTYNTIYKRFLKRGSGEMLDLAGFKPGDSFLDLCCGTGRASLEVMNRGASRIVSVDQTREKLHKHKFNFVDGEQRYFKNDYPTFYEYTVKRFLYDIKDCYDMKFDCIFCQQAVNYWMKKDSNLKETYIELIVNALTRNGRFVFNTFNKKPSELPVVKEYDLEDLHYVEVSQLIDGTVHHAQFCEGLKPDFQKFRWISTEEFKEMLRPFFRNITIHSDGPTDIYVCSQKK